MNSQQQVIQGTFSDVSELHVSKLRTIAFKLSSSLQGAAGFTKRPPHQSCSRPPPLPLLIYKQRQEGCQGRVPRNNESSRVGFLIQSPWGFVGRIHDVHEHAWRKSAQFSPSVVSDCL